MGGTGIIDQFLEAFTRYIDSGFGLLGGEVGFLATTLAAIDVTLAGLFWSWGADEDILPRLVKEDPVCRCLRFPDRQLEQLGSHHLRELCRLGSESLGHRPFSADFFETGKDRPGRA